MITPSFFLTATERVLPRLALDFTTASLDSRVTFTRTGNTATVTNSSGLVSTINADLPRFDYDPISLVCKGLLIEEQRTNLFTYSSEFDNAAWEKNNTTITPNTIVAPDGTLTADAIVETTTSNTFHNIRQSVSVSSGQVITFSFYAKESTRRYAWFGVFSTTGAYGAGTRFRDSTIDLQTGLETGTTAGTLTYTFSSSSVGNGWYRYVIVMQATTGSGTVFGSIGPAESSSSYASYTGAVDKNIYAWGTQFEVGSFATSYIPTVASTVTRNADIATMTGTNFSDWFNAPEGAFMAQFWSIGTGGFVIQAGTANNFNSRITIGVSPNNFIVSNSGGANQAALGNTSLIGAVAKICGTYKVDSFAASLNGATTLTDTSGVVAAPDSLALGYRNTSSPNGFFSGWLQKVNFWPQRLTNNEVQAFSK
jgi:hypothetical protein